METVVSEQDNPTFEDYHRLSRFFRKNKPGGGHTNRLSETHPPHRLQSICFSERRKPSSFLLPNWETMNALHVALLLANI